MKRVACLLLVVSTLSWVGCRADHLHTHHVAQASLRKLQAEGPSLSSLNTAGPNCIEAFYNTTSQHYAKDDTCTYAINAAFAAVSKDQCPEGGSEQGSVTARCLQKSPATSDAWVEFLTDCPLQNVVQGSGRGGFSCFAKLESLSDFEAFLKPGAAANAAASSSSNRGQTLHGAAAAAAAVLLLVVSM